MIIFLDETSYHENVTSGREFVGTGILTANDMETVEQTIATALNLLKADPDIHLEKTASMDQRTLASRYFHACEDSKNAHSAICTSINKHLEGDFHFNYRLNSGKHEKAYQDTFVNAAIHIGTTRNPVKIMIEQRSGFSEVKATSLIEYVFEAIEWGAYDYYMIPKYFPEYEVCLVDKSNLGVQITDFLMWAQNRSRTVPPNKVWADRVKTKFKTYIGEVGNEFDSGDITFKKGVKHELHSEIYPQAAFPLKDFDGKEHLVRLFAFIDYRVKQFLLKENDLPHIRMLYKDIIDEYNKPTTLYHSEFISRIGSCYIRIFDMKPIYTQQDKENIEVFQELLLSKKLAGLVIRKDLVNGVMTTQFLAKAMRGLITNLQVKTQSFEKLN